MSDDDLVRRGDAIEALCGRMDREEYGHAKAAVALDIEEIRSLPAVPPSPAERLARALEIAVRHLPELQWGTTGNKHPGDPVPLTAPIMCPMCESRGIFDEIDKFRHDDGCPVAMASAALAAFRAAKPPVSDGKSDSTGAAPPAAEPAPLQKPPGSCDEGAVRANNPEPAKEPEPCGTCGGSPRRGCSGACDDGKPCADVCPKCGAA